MIAVRVGHAARGGEPAAGRAIDEAVGALVGVDAERAEAGDERRDAVALLDAQLAAPRTVDLAAVRRERRNRRQLVDEAGHFVGRDLERARADRLRR